jgi:hypothetical protein
MNGAWWILAVAIIMAANAVYFYRLGKKQWKLLALAALIFLADAIFDLLRRTQ